MDRILAPWTEQQTAALNAYQRSGRMHPITCGGDHELHQTLIAEPDGWHCPDEDCDFRQDWALAFMTDLEALDELPQLTPTRRVDVTGGQPCRPHPALEELRKAREQLRATETELGQERARTAALREQLRMLESTRALSGRPLVPEQTAGASDATWLQRPDCEPAWVAEARPETGTTDVVPTGEFL